MSGLGKGFISNAYVTFDIVVYHNLGDVKFCHSFTLLQKQPEADKKFYKNFVKYMTKEFGPADQRWSYSRSLLGYFHIRFRDYKDAAQFKILL